MSTYLTKLPILSTLQVLRVNSEIKSKPPHPYRFLPPTAMNPIDLLSICRISGLPWCQTPLLHKMVSNPAQDTFLSSTIIQKGTMKIKPIRSHLTWHTWNSFYSQGLCYFRSVLQKHALIVGNDKWKHNSQSWWLGTSLTQISRISKF